MAATHQGTCPICHRVQKLVGGGHGSMAKHGFRRPAGWHQETGGCWGTRKTPWEISPEAARQYIEKVLVPNITSRMEFAARIEAGTEKALYFTLRNGTAKVTAEDIEIQGRTYGEGIDRAAVNQLAVAGFERDLQFRTKVEMAWEDWQKLTTFQKAGMVKVREQREEAGRIETEKKYQERQIAGWKKGELIPVAAEPAGKLPFEPTGVVVAREARRGMHGQTRYEAWNGKGWERVPMATLRPLLDAGKARWRTEEERKTGVVA